jgi:ComF family protein
MRNLYTHLSGFLTQAVDMVLPPRCIITGDTVEAQGMVAPRAWAELDFISSPFCNACGFPFDFEADGESLCGPCVSERPAYESARATLKYNESSRGLILGFKHGDKTHAVRAFVPWLKKTGEYMLACADYLVPVPLHRWRLVSRRYNQAALIAQALSKECGLAVILDGLERVRATPSQGHLTAKQRFKNVKKAFTLNPKAREKIKGKTIVLIDDVYTTGATVQECTDVLLKGGAAQVHVLTLARVVKEGFG